MKPTCHRSYQMLFACLLAAVLVPLAGCGSPTSPTPTQPPPPPVGGGWALLLDRPITGKYEGLSFPDSLHGWVISDVGDIVATSNGGASWTVQATGMGHLRSVDFLDAQRGYAGTLAGQLYHTADAGVTWADITSALPKAAIGFCGITHVGNRVHIVGRYTGATDYYSSPDGGSTWQYQNLDAVAQGLVDVVFVDASTGFIGGMAPSSKTNSGPATILKTTDGGATWRTVFVDGSGRGYAWKIFPVSAQLIYVTLENFDGVYRVAKSVDGGETWAVQTVATDQPIPVKSGLQGIGFLDAKRGWVGGFFSGMFATTNGGITWAPVDMEGGNINRFRRQGSTLITAGTHGVIRYQP